MTRSAHFRRLVRLRRRVPAAILVAGLLLTAGVAGTLHRAELMKARQHFVHTVEIDVKTIHDHMTTYVALLQGAAGLFAAQHGDVSAAAFHEYVGRMDLPDHYPGVFGVGFSQRLPAQNAPALEARMRRLGFPDFTIHPMPAPQGPDGTVDTIVYLEPLNRPNRVAIGYDMFSNPVRRAAMQRAGDSGTVAASGRVRLVQEIGPRKQAGFLLYLPVYRGGGVPDSVTARRAALLGFVYSPFRAGDLFSGIFADKQPDGVDMAIYDGSPGPGTLLYDSARPGAPADPRFTRTVALDVAGRPWTVRFTTNPLFDGGFEPSGIWFIVGGGVLATLLLAWVAAREGRASLAEFRAQAKLHRLNRGLERRVAQRTAELEQVNAQLLRESEERQQIEEQLRQSQKMEAVGQLTGGIAHDFNNLLTVIAANAEFLERSLGDAPQHRRRLDAMKAAAERGARLTSQLLAFSRRQDLTPCPVDLDAILTGMADLLRSTMGRGIRIERRRGGGLWPAMVDPTQIEMAILNLALNARDAMAESGTLTVTTANVVVDPPHGVPRGPEAPPPGEHVMVSVADTGIGIAPDVLARVCEPFFTTKEIGKGSGLGLSQVYGLAKQSGGGIRIATAPGAGTTVVIYLPRAVSAGCAVPDEPPGRGSVLLVDDDDTARAATATMLQEAGYTVIEASDGHAALDVLGRGTPVDVLATDFAMPGMNGLELAAQARARRPGLPVLFVTGFADSAALSGYVPDGRLLQKPFRARELVAKLEEALGQREPTEALVLPMRWQ